MFARRLLWHFEAMDARFWAEVVPAMLRPHFSSEPIRQDASAEAAMLVIEVAEVSEDYPIDCRQCGRLCGMPKKVAFAISRNQTE